MSILQKTKKTESISGMLVLLLFFLTSVLHFNSTAQCFLEPAYSGAMTTGNQAYTGQMAMQFGTSGHIEVNQLGVFDDDLVNGINGAVTVGIIDEFGTSTVVGPIVISGTMGTLNGRFRMVDLVTPVVLPPGVYHIVAVGFDGNDPNGNTAFPGGLPTGLSSSLVISYGGNRFDPTTTWDGTLPGTIDGGPTGRYHAGTFRFNVVTPEVSSTVLGTPISNPGPLLLTRQICNVNNNVTATDIIQTNTSNDAFLYIEIASSSNINLAGGGPGGDTDRLDDLPLDGPLGSIGTTWMNFIDDIRLQVGSQWGFVVIRITPYTDLDGSDDLNAGDCTGTPIELRFEIQPTPQTIATFVNPTAQDGEICSGETIDINLGVNAFEMIGGGAPTLSDYEFEVVQIRYSTDGGGTYPLANSGYPVGLTGGTYSVGDIISSAIAEISETLVNTTLVPIYLRFQVMAQLTNDPFCNDGPINIRLVINPNPSASIIPDPAAICAGFNLTLDGNPSGGTEPYSTHAWTGPGAVYLSLTNTKTTVFNHNMPGDYNLTYTVTDDNGCTASDNIIVTVNANPTVSITPDPAEACILTDIFLNGNPTAGTPPFTHSWTGVASAYLNNTTIVDPIFNHFELGAYELIYTVTDANGCTGSGTITIEINDNADPVITCPVGPLVMNTDFDRCDAVVCFPITTTDDCPFYYPPTLAGHTYIGSFNGSTYFRSNGFLSWEAANLAATSLGGHLVNITSPGEQAYLAANIPTNFFSSFWIGLRWSSSIVPGGAYKWTSGTPLGYTNWAAGEPVLLGNQDYVFYWDINAPLLNGWHDTPAEILALPVLNRYIIEFSGLPKTLDAGLPSGSIFPLGTTTVTYSTEDSAGNVDECSFDVQVVDNQNPVVVCPADVTVYLLPLDCEEEVFYPNPATATDNCSISAIDYSIPSGSLFPIGITPVTVTATDGSNNTDECTFNVIVYDYINPNLACKPVNLSLDEFCSSSLDPTIFLTGWQGPSPGEILLGCPENFIITFYGKNDEIITVDQLKHHIGKTLKFKVSHTLQSFTCWNEVLIEDKYPPTIDCRDIEVSCLTDTDDLVLGFASDNCIAHPLIVGEVHDTIDCNDDYIGRITRRYVAIDKYGNQSVDSCTATILLLRSKFGGIVAPANAKLQCSDTYKKDTKGFGFPDPSVTGVPTFNGLPVYPTSALQMQFCNATIDYEDVLLISSPCKTKIRRTWKIYEWHCSGLEIFFIGLPQMIDIVDDTAPVIPIVNDMILTTNTKSCSATAQLPNLNITDNCNSLKSIIINAYNNGAPVGTLNTNGGFMELPVGDNGIEYTAIDICGNSSVRRFTIKVQDDTNPIAVCDQFTTVSIKTNGYTEVTAVAVDDGSFDECGGVKLELQRMEDPCGTDFNIGWHSKVGFCCLDANISRTVILLVTDVSENTNMCMVTVNVQEKVNPSISCPADVTITDCTYTFDPANLDFYFGAAIIYDNCPANNLLTQTHIDSRNQCGIGDLVRNFEVSSNGILYGSCSQTISFSNNDAFDGNDTLDLKWPANYTAINACNVLMVEPENLPEGFNFPVIHQDACDRVGFTKEDLVFPFTTNGACFKVIRKWTVIDWCQEDGDGNYRTWTHEQEIKVMDNVSPMITSPDTTRISESFDVNCLGGLIELTASATDCTPTSELSWTYTIYDDQGVVYKTGTGNDASGIYPLGDYLIEFTVEDRCGNLALTSYTFEVISVKPATPICFKGLSSNLVTMDLNMDGTPDTAMVEVHVTKFNNHSKHPCYPDSPLLFSYSPDVNDTLRVFGCSHLGEQPITMYVTDLNGNQSFCTTTLLVTNNDTLHYRCPNNMLLGAITGRIANEKDLPILDVEVSLQGTEKVAQFTEQSGKFGFYELPYGNNYSINPEKDGDDNNGVSTLDMVLIQRHILGIEKLPSLYKYVAADVNNDNRINSVDLVELRKIVLGTMMSFPNNTSWRFVEKDFQFIDPSNPLALFIPGNCSFANMQQDMKADFIGVKIGDVNETAKLDQWSPENVESRHNFAFVTDNKVVKAGEEFQIMVKANSNATLFGWQQKMELSHAEWVGVTSNLIPSILESVSVDGTQVGFSVAIGQGQVVNHDQTLFVVTLRAIKDGFIKDMINFVDDRLQAEVYVDGVQTPKVLRWQFIDVADFPFEITKQQPNPWKESTMIGFTIPTENYVSIKVKDQTGRTVYSSTDRYNSGEQQVTITREKILYSGLYFVEIKYNNEVKTIKTIMID
ncbi:MAG: HYR domain-containing protein [Saprospiraceae bacterium]